LFAISLDKMSAKKMSLNRKYQPLSVESEVIINHKRIWLVKSEVDQVKLQEKNCQDALPKGPWQGL